MKRWLPMLVVAGLALGSAPTFAATKHKETPAQHQKSVACKSEAKQKGLKGTERKNYMHDCMSKTS